MKKMNNRSLWGRIRNEKGGKRGKVMIDVEVGWGKKKEEKREWIIDHFGEEEEEEMKMEKWENILMKIKIKKWKEKVLIKINIMTNVWR